MSRLALGTAQFGPNYGITNESGELSDEAVVGMLRVAQEAGVSLFDTAADYGASQHRLGKFARTGGGQSYITKFSLPVDGIEPTAENIYLASMAQLCVENLHGLLFHKLSDLKDERCGKAIEVLREARSNGVVTRIGVSVYGEEGLVDALEAFPDLDILQLPANVLDFRLLESQAVSRLRDRGTEIHVRSVFLQGLLLATPDALPDYFEGLRPALQSLHQQAVEQNISVLALTLGIMRHHPSIDAVIVGATSVPELESITQSWLSATIRPRLNVLSAPAELLDPRNWPSGRPIS